jgi:hypothetical protein
MRHVRAGDKGKTTYANVQNVSWAKTVRLEIQGNTLPMIYGKEAKSVFISMLKDTGGAEQKHDELAALTKVVGGLHHVLYEVTQAGLIPADVKELAKALSKEYHNQLREPKPVNHPAFINLCYNLLDFISRPEIKFFFHDHPVPLSVSLCPLPPRQS